MLPTVSERPSSVLCPRCGTTIVEVVETHERWKTLTKEEIRQRKSPKRTRTSTVVGAYCPACSWNK